MDTKFVVKYVDHLGINRKEEFTDIDEANDFFEDERENGSSRGDLEIHTIVVLKSFF